MITYLDDIIRYKQAERERRQPRANGELERLVADAPLVRPLLDTIGTYRAFVIAECKKSSPSRGLLVPDYDPVALARTYQQAGATAISVLTDQHFFGGSLADLGAVRAAVDLPVLRKDFILDERDVFETRAAGADLVLLIARVLPDPVLGQLVASSRRLGLEPLVEVHDEADVQSALETMALLIGINNRDLSTFQTDLAATERLLGMIPEGVTVVSESGISSPADIVRLHIAGAHGVLIGEALVTASDPGALLAEMVLAACPDCRRQMPTADNSIAMGDIPS